MVGTENIQKEISSSPKNDNKKRVEYLDTIKAISIFWVVFCHLPLLKTNSVLDNIAMVFCWSAVPCFFMTTGALYLNKDWNFKKYLKKLFNIYIVMCIWKIIYLIVYHYVGTINIKITPIKDIINYTFFLTGLKGVDDGHFWFMYAYISIFLIYPFFNIMFKNMDKYKGFLIFIMIFVFIATALTYTINFVFKYFHIENIQISNIGRKLVYGNYSFVLLFFIMGGFLYKYNIYERFKDKKKLIRMISIILIILGVLGLVFLKKALYNTFEWRGIYIEDGYHCSSTILLSLGIFILLQGINIKFKIPSKLFSEIGKNTIGIYYLHKPILEIVNKLEIEYRGSLINVLKSIAVIVVCYLIIIIIKKIPVLKKLV